MEITCDQFWGYVLATEELFRTGTQLPTNFDGEFLETIGAHLNACERCERLFSIREEKDEERMWKNLEKAFGTDREELRQMFDAVIEKIRRSRN